MTDARPAPSRFRSAHRKIAFLLLTLLGCTPDRTYDTSDHFNGKTFLNPTLADQVSPGISDVFRMIREARPDWPARAETTGVPRLAEDLGQDGMAITFVNHATFLIQLPGLNILTDPVWSDRVSPVGWFGPKRIRRPGIDLDKLPAIDLVLISHNHYDHLDTATLKTLNERFAPSFVVPLGNADLLSSLGIEDVRELDWWESAGAGSRTRVILTPAQHSSGRGLLDRDRSLWGSFYIKDGDRSLFFGGDGGYSTQFSDIRERLGPPEVALLGIGAYEPRWFMKPLHMNPAEAVTAHRDLGAGTSIGMHFGTFQLASEGFAQPERDLSEALDRQGVAHDRFQTMKEGETMLRPPPPK
ncbi:MBL fold metallo-hydrolase [Mangrovicoccus algicola]|uniref:MBL fold metallo-hydrolase n=1 Tax=Mangrovicoccus algicola TaxID=2771008 RepID=A0A8J6YWB5_9RHOB|nr:MBL fold metallo-hydrolase [Mangrovicoccus algicola]MBE3637238.1 MBL fold metallo-hydrolase [Mangrovicoccus algicola]